MLNSAPSVSINVYWLTADRLKTVFHVTGWTVDKDHLILHEMDGGGGVYVERQNIAFFTVSRMEAS